MIRCNKLLLFILVLSPFLSFSQTNYYDFNDDQKIIIFKEDFVDNSNKWELGTNGPKLTMISDDNLIFRISEQDALSTISKEVFFDDTKDFEIEVSLKSKINENSGCGFMWGSDDYNFFAFMLNNTGYSIAKVDEFGKDEQFLSWQSKFLKLNDFNKITIRKTGDKFHFFLNENYIIDADFSNFKGYSLGFIALDVISIYVDHIYVSYLQETTQPITNHQTPVIQIAEPELLNGVCYTKEDNIQIIGTATSKVGIQTITINGNKIDNKADGYFSTNFKLTSEKTVATIKATDIQGNPSIFKFNIIKDSDTSSYKKLALVIGNSNYINGGTLRNPCNDADSLYNALKSLGFTVLKYLDADQKIMKSAMDEFGSKLVNFDIGLFFYAGHGMQVNGINYLIPVDAKIENENQVEYDCVRADRILANMEDAGSKTNIIILDACRDNPFQRSWRSSGSQGLAFMDAPSGSIIAYATSPGSYAFDGSGKNGLYTSALLQHIKSPNTTIEEVFKKVRKTVREESNGKQVPWESTSLEGMFYFSK
ncbi:MAG: caspase family protein [Bacteroidota bacterium]